MPKILIINDPAGISKKETINLLVGENVLDWIISRYGKNGFNIPTKIYNNILNDDNEIILDEGGYLLLNKPLIQGELFIIVHCPEGGGSLLQKLHPMNVIGIIHEWPLSFFNLSDNYSMLLTPLSYLNNALLSRPESPTVPRNSDTDNNSVSAQTNKIRLLDRIPDNYGRMKVYPDLIAQPYFFYENNDQYVIEFFCIGRGYYDIDEVKHGETLITDIVGSTATIYEPLTRPSEVLNVRTSSAVDGQILYGTNEEFVNLSNIDVTYNALNSFYSDDDGFAEFFDLNIGDTFQVTGATAIGDILIDNTKDTNFSGNTISSNNTGAYAGIFLVGNTITITDTSPTGHNQIVMITSRPDDETIVTDGSFNTANNKDATLTENIDNNGTFTFQNVTKASQGGDPTVYRYTVTVAEDLGYTTPGTLINVSSIISDLNKANEAGFFNVPLDVDQVWVDLQFLRGLISSNDSTLRINFNITLRRVSDLVEELTQVEVVGKSRSSVSETFMITPLFPGEEYQCKVTRTSESSESDSDESQWTRLAGVEIITKTDFGDITTAYVETKRTTQATNSSQRKINMIAERKLGTWTGTGTDFTAIAATSRMADAMVNILNDQYGGNKVLSQIDLESLYEIQDRLDTDPIYGDLLGRFCYSFGDRTISAYSEALACANACRVILYREGALIKFKRDESKEFTTTLFNTRNKKPQSESKTLNLFQPNDYDGVELEYVTEEGESGIVYFPEDQTSLYPSKINGIGMRNYDQAWNRAYFEYQRIIYKRIKLSTVVTGEGLLVELTDKVSNADGTNADTQCGEVKSVTSSNIYTYDKIIIDDSNENYVILRNNDGSVSDQIEINSISGNEYGFNISSFPDFDIFARGGGDKYQVGTLYNIIAFDSKNVTDYSVDNIKPQGDGYVGLQLSIYDERVYIGDITEPTPQTELTTPI